MLVVMNKPFDVLCQFSDDTGRITLADVVANARKRRDIELPKGASLTDQAWQHIYPAGRLDRDSEGLLLLSDDGPLIHRISDPRHKFPKTYWAQVEHEASEEHLDPLRHGINLNDGKTLPAEVRRLPDDAESTLWPRDPPIRTRQSIPTSWIEIVLHEGRNRQVRRMTAAVGLPTLRLIRVAIGPHRLDGLRPGQLRVLDTAPAVAVRPAQREHNKHPRRRR